MHEDELIEQVLQVMPEIGRLLHAAVAAHPVVVGRPLGQIKTLMHLYHNDPSTVSEIAAALGVGLPAASELIDRLVDDGLVERGVNPDDRRQVLVRLTAEARDFATRIHQLRRAQIRAALERMEPHERPVFVRSMQAFAEALRLEPGDLTPCPRSTER
jgi:DNA-binding MarR family transcriptional regulator